MGKFLTTDVGNDPQSAFLRTVNTRIAGGGRLTATAAPLLAVVDLREFRASLPSLMNAQSIQLVPVTLTVGDYILSPDICIERKSIPDLVSSFKDGRLYHQVEAMSKHYKYPMLLIEFASSRHFGLDLTATATADAADYIRSPDQRLQDKLVVLTLAFPRLRLIWASSPYESALTMLELKKNQPEPDPDVVKLVGLEPGCHDAATEAVFHQAPEDMLREVAGVTPLNAELLMLAVTDLQELSNMAEEELAVLVGKEAGQKIWTFFNHSIFD